jgi:hypothetical protein
MKIPHIPFPLLHPSYTILALPYPPHPLPSPLLLSSYPLLSSPPLFTSSQTSIYIYTPNIKIPPIISYPLLSTYPIHLIPPYNTPTSTISSYLFSSLSHFILSDPVLHLILSDPLFYLICEPKSDATPERVTIVVYVAGLAGCFTLSSPLHPIPAQHHSVYYILYYSIPSPPPLFHPAQHNTTHPIPSSLPYHSAYHIISSPITAYHSA